MLSKSRIKLIRQLNKKKYRYEQQLFLVEGLKSVLEFAKAGFAVKYLFSLKPMPELKAQEKTRVTEGELKTISNQKSPNQVLAVFEMPDPKPVKREGFTLLLDSVNDPGNLGTIIRLCDWFGVDQLVCSNDTVDCYNPKTVQASMGSLARISVVYTNINTFLDEEKRPVYGSFLKGENIYKTALPEQAVLVMGNEANGISADVEERITRRITIPRFGPYRETESLNVAMATAVLLSEFKRKTL